MQHHRPSARRRPNGRSPARSAAPGQRTVVAAPAEGILHGAMPSLLHDDALSGPRSGARVRSFERLADRRLAWVYFSDNWFQGIRFPAEAVEVGARDWRTAVHPAHAAIGVEGRRRSTRSTR